LDCFKQKDNTKKEKLDDEVKSQEYQNDIPKLEVCDNKKFSDSEEEDDVEVCL